MAATVSVCSVDGSSGESRRQWTRVILLLALFSLVGGACEGSNVGERVEAGFPTTALENAISLCEEDGFAWEAVLEGDAGEQLESRGLGVTVVAREAASRSGSDWIATRSVSALPDPESPALPGEFLTQAVKRGDGVLVQLGPAEPWLKVSAPRTEEEQEVLDRIARPCPFWPPSVEEVDWDVSERSFFDSGDARRIVLTGQTGQELVLIYADGRGLQSFEFESPGSSVEGLSGALRSRGARGTPLEQPKMAEVRDSSWEEIETLLVDGPFGPGGGG